MAYWGGTVRLWSCELCESEDEVINKDVWCGLERCCEVWVWEVVRIVWCGDWEVVGL